MKIDWKHLATTKGYKSLKSAFIRDVIEASKQKRPMRDKAEYLRQFKWVIGRAKHYSKHSGYKIEHWIDEWEQKRNYCWLNFYQDCNQPKLTKTYWLLKKAKPKKEKPRWPMARKKRGY